MLVLLLILGIGGPIKSIRCVQVPAIGAVAPIQRCIVTLRKPAAAGDRITIVHSSKNPLASAETMWEFGKNGYDAGVSVIDLYESPETEVVSVRYDGRGSTKRIK